jgi:hypothetical protein
MSIGFERKTQTQKRYLRMLRASSAHPRRHPHGYPSLPDKQVVVFVHRTTGRGSPYTSEGLP